MLQEKYQKKKCENRESGPDLVFIPMEGINVNLHTIAVGCWLVVEVCPRIKDISAIGDLKEKKKALYRAQYAICLCLLP
jgi:hypothetical protein